MCTFERMLFIFPSNDALERRTLCGKRSKRHNNLLSCMRTPNAFIEKCVTLLLIFYFCVEQIQIYVGYTYLHLRNDKTILRNYKENVNYKLFKKNKNDRRTYISFLYLLYDLFAFNSYSVRLNIDFQ